MAKNLIILLCMSFYALSAYSQTKAQPQSFTFPTLQLSLAELIADIEAQSDYYASYNPSKINLTLEIILPQKEMAITDLKSILEGLLDYEVTIDHESKKIFFLEGAYKYISGIIRDSFSLESLPGVAIYAANNFAVYTNDEGYFTLRVPREEAAIYLSYLGYKTKTLKISDVSKQSYAINLLYDNRLPDIIISTEKNNPSKDRFPTDINATKYIGAVGIGGTTDLIAKVKRTSGVSVGSEAQSGYTVRGGGPDQNLILLDGLPVFDISHLGGISSIFMENTIKKADFYKSGIPSKFGGKLSSVLDIRLKDGNRKEYERSVNIGLESISGYLEGPISDNISFIASGRKSLLSLYAKPLLKASRNLDTDIKYDDVYAKISYWINPSNRLSLSYYTGNDFIKTKSNDLNDRYAYVDNALIKWRNELISLNWRKSLSNKVYLHTQLGRAAFDFASKSSNQVISNLQNSTAPPDTSRLDIQTLSCQENLSFSSQLDIFTDHIGKINCGIGGINHVNSPSILEERAYNENDITECTDSSYVTQEIYLFVDNKLQLSKTWTMNSGLRANTFLGTDASYFNLQPRLNLQYRNGQHHFNAGYSRMNQFLHLLVNPTSGLPADLWVPSTKDIAPEISNLFSLDYALDLSPHQHLSIGGFYNTYENLIEYTNPLDLFQGIVLDHSEFNVTIDNIPFEERISTLSGRSYGLELAYKADFDQLDIDVAYTLSRSERSIVVADTIQNYLYKYDRPHNITAGISYQLKNKQSLSISWVFGNGNRFTLPRDKETIGGRTVIIAKERNNVTLSNYHHLDMQYQKRWIVKEHMKIDLTLGIYNIYNNRNPFYSYLQDDRSTPDAEVIEISLLTLLPQINARFTW